MGCPNSKADVIDELSRADTTKAGGSPATSSPGSSPATEPAATGGFAPDYFDLCPDAGDGGELGEG